jgi:DNA-binding NarL/FixJ family response regulator
MQYLVECIFPNFIFENNAIKLAVLPGNINYSTSSCEFEIIKLIYDGLNSNQNADTLFLRRHTVDVYLCSYQILPPRFNI